MGKTGNASNFPSSKKVIVSGEVDSPPHHPLGIHMSLSIRQACLKRNNPSTKKNNDNNKKVQICSLSVEVSTPPSPHHVPSYIHCPHNVTRGMRVGGGSFFLFHATAAQLIIVPDFRRSRDQRD